VLATLLDPTEGDALVNGISVVEHPEKARKHVGYMPDSLPAHADISVHEYLDFFARAYGVRASRRPTVLDGIEEFTGLRSFRDRVLKALSKGMKQRVSLARALVHDPKVLILDEPAAGLDPRARVELRELLQILGDQGKAVLISSHILTELAEICTGAVIIEQGRLLRAGGIQSLYETDTPLRTIGIRVLDRQEVLFKYLLQIPGIEAVRRLGPGLEIDISGDEQQASQILKALITDGFAIVEFRPLQADLEDIFMHVTNGALH
jgi:ABC-2 type transport system ATP-binding protein